MICARVYRLHVSALKPCGLASHFVSLAQVDQTFEGVIEVIAEMLGIMPCLEEISVDDSRFNDERRSGSLER